MKNIEQKISEVANYFKQKVLTGDYEFIDCGEYTAQILINNKYRVFLWIANRPKHDFRIYNHANLLNIFDDKFLFNTEKERIEGWEKLKPYIIDHKKKKLAQEKQDHIDILKEELSNLEKSC